jgi:hypothetical protein
MLYSATPWTGHSVSHQNAVKLWDPHAFVLCRLHSAESGNAPLSTLPRLVRDKLSLQYTGFNSGFDWSVVRVVQYEGFQKETGDSHVEYVRADGFPIILKQQNPLLEMHEARNKVRSLVGSRRMQIECKPWMKYVNYLFILNTQRRFVLCLIPKTYRNLCFPLKYVNIMNLHTYINTGMDMLNVHTMTDISSCLCMPVWMCVCVYVNANVWLVWNSSIDRTYMPVE